MKVKLQDVLEAMDFTSPETEYYYSTKTEEVLMIFDGMVKDELEHVIRGRGAYRRFKDKLYELGLEQKWYKYRDDSYEKVARDWCERNKIEIVE